MKKLLGIVLLLILSSISVFAQKTAPKTVKKAAKPSAAPQVPEIQGHCIDLMSEDSIKFFLYLDDVLQNETAQTHVEVCNLMNDGYETKIVLGSDPQASCTGKMDLKGYMVDTHREKDVWGHLGLRVGIDKRSGKFCIGKSIRFFEPLKNKIRNENRTK